MSIIVFKEKDGTVNINAAGYVTGEPKVYDKVVLFGLCYAKGKFLDCKAWRDRKAGETAERLEKHDDVFVCGRLNAYTDKEGKEKSNLLTDAIFSMSDVGGIVSPFPAPTQKQDTNNDNPLDTLGAKLQEYDDSDEELPF